MQMFSLFLTLLNKTQLTYSAVNKYWAKSQDAKQIKGRPG